MNEEVMIPKSYHDKVCEEIIRFKDKQFYDAVHLLDDGTLEITVGDYTKVKRVLVEDCNNFGNLFYENDTDRPQGEWIRDRYWSRGVGMGEEYGFFYKCSMCEYEVESGYTRCGFNYCPNCGARMKGAGDERHDI